MDEESGETKGSYFPTSGNMYDDFLENLEMMTGADTGETSTGDFATLDWEDFFSFMSQGSEDEGEEAVINLATYSSSGKDDSSQTSSYIHHSETQETAIRNEGDDDEGDGLLLGKRKLLVTPESSSTSSSSSSNGDNIIRTSSINTGTGTASVKRPRPTSSSVQGDSSYDIIEFPVEFMDAINTGQYERLWEVIKKYMVEDCSFQTDSSDNPINGRHHIMQYYKFVFEHRPDLVMVLKKTGYTKRTELRLKFYCTFSSLPVTERTKYTSRVTSFISKMDFSKLSTDEIKRLAEREKLFKEKKQRVKVAGKGEMIAKLNRFDQISKLSVISLKVLSYDPVDEAES